MTTLGEHTHRLRDPHAACSLTACLDPLHPGPCKGWKGNPEEAFERVSSQARKGIRAFNTAKGVKGTKASHRQALLSYVNGSGPINRSLRFSKGEGSNDPRIVAEIGAMDRAMAGSKLTHPITVQRAVSPSAFGGKDTNIDLTGAEYTDHAFGSTGTDLGLILKHFHTTSSGRKPIIADITVPAGMGAIRVPPGMWGDEKEILLDRGAHYRVVKDNGYITTPKGKFRHITLEVVPGGKAKVKKVDLGDKNQEHRNTAANKAAGAAMEHGGPINDGPPPKSQTASITLTQAVECFCLETHKPGLCKGQHRGDTEPGTQDATKQTPAQVAQVAVTGLNQAIAQAQAVAAQNATNPKLAAMAQKAIAGYKKALGPHQQVLKDAAKANATAAKTGAQDAKQQTTLDKQKANAANRAAKQKVAAEKRAEQKHETLEKRAQAIIDRRREAARVAKMSPKQRAAYGKQQTAKAKALHKAAEDKVLKEAGRK